MKTVEEAEKMYCPASHNVEEFCCADQCMAWSWGKGEISRYVTSRAIKSPDNVNVAPPRGYCGLAGKPND